MQYTHRGGQGRGQCACLKRTISVLKTRHVQAVHLPMMNASSSPFLASLSDTSKRAVRPTCALRRASPDALTAPDESAFSSYGHSDQLFDMVREVTVPGSGTPSIVTSTRCTPTERGVNTQTSRPSFRRFSCHGEYRFFSCTLQIGEK